MLSGSRLSYLHRNHKVNVAWIQSLILFFKFMYDIARHDHKAAWHSCALRLNQRAGPAVQILAWSGKLEDCLQQKVYEEPYINTNQFSAQRRKVLLYFLLFIVQMYCHPSRLLCVVPNFLGFLAERNAAIFAADSCNKLLFLS